MTEKCFTLETLFFLFKKIILEKAQTYYSVVIFPREINPSYYINEFTSEKTT